MQCPECSGILKERKGKNGNFLGCSNYPKCKYTQALESGVDRFVDKSNAQMEPKTANPPAIKTTTQTTTIDRIRVLELAHKIEFDSKDNAGLLDAIIATAGKIENLLNGKMPETNEEEI